MGSVVSSVLHAVDPITPWNEQTQTGAALTLVLLTYGAYTAYGAAAGAGVTTGASTTAAAGGAATAGGAGASTTFLGLTTAQWTALGIAGSAALSLSQQAPTMPDMSDYYKAQQDALNREANANVNAQQEYYNRLMQQRRTALSTSLLMSGDTITSDTTQGITDRSQYAINVVDGNKVPIV